MRKLLVLLAFTPLLICGFPSHSQSFCLSDSEFQIGDTLRRNFGIIYCFPDYHTTNYIFLDSLVDFINLNNISCLQIESNTDSRGSSEFNDTLSIKRAKAIADYLYSKGIDPNSLISIGNGEKDPVISEEEINMMKTKEEKEKAHALNRQTVFRIIEIR